METGKFDPTHKNQRPNVKTKLLTEARQDGKRILHAGRDGRVVEGGGLENR